MAKGSAMKTIGSNKVGWPMDSWYTKTTVATNYSYS